jgi:carboxypeptidase C (cathepsin A)
MKLLPNHRGYFQLSDEGSYTNDYAWNKVANMLYLESPAGSGSGSGFSTCNKGERQRGYVSAAQRLGILDQ